MTVKDRAGLFGFVLAISAAAMVLAAGADWLVRLAGVPAGSPLHVFVAAAACVLPFSGVMGLRLAQLSRLNDRLEIAARYDRLTGLPNRQSFMEMLAEIPPREGVVALLDVDFFKAVNDTHGHFVGDAVLAHVAQVLAAACRPDDLICRFGGEEFAVLFAGATPDVAQDLAEAMVRKVADSHLPAAGKTHRLTISAGLALRAGQTDPAHALQAADRALYRAKALGRNRAAAAWDGQGFPAIPAAA